MIEIVVIDDGSSDGTREIVDYLASCHNNIVVLHQDNSGVSVARNKGIQLSSGKYITFLDADDYISEDYCLTLINEIQNNNVQLVCSKIEGMNYTKEYVVDIEKRTLDIDGIRSEFEYLYRNWFFHNACGKLYYSEIAKKCWFPEKVRIGEDLIYNLSYFTNINKCSIIDYYGYHYQMNINSAVHRFKEDDYALQKMIREKSYLFAKDQLKAMGQIKAVDEVFLNNVVDLIIVCITSEDRPTIISTLRQILSDKTFADVSTARVSGIKRKVVLFLAKGRMIGLLYMIGRINRSRRCYKW